MSLLTRLGIRKNGTLIGRRPGVNLIEGSNVTISAADNPSAGRVDVTIGASGGGGSGTSLEDAYTLPSGSSIGDQSITVDRSAAGFENGATWAIIERNSLNCELRKVTGGLPGTTLTLADGILKTNSWQFVASTKTIRLSRGIVSIVGNGTTVTVQTDTAHPYTVGQQLIVYGNLTYGVHNIDFGNPANSAEYSQGRQVTVATVPDSTHFTYLDTPTGTENAGWVIDNAHWGVDPMPLQFANQDKLVVSGSASNNGTYTINRIFRYGHKATFAMDPFGFTVAETLVNENASAANSTITIRSSLNIAHGAGARVVLTNKPIVDLEWYGIRAATITQRTLAINRALREVFRQDNPRVRVNYPLTVNDEIWLDTSVRFGGDSSDNAQFAADTPGSPVWASGNASSEVAVLHLMRNGNPCMYWHGGASPRQFIDHFNVSGNDIYAKHAADGVTNGSTTFTSATGGFTSAMIGMRLVGTDSTISVPGTGVSFSAWVVAVPNGTTLTLDRTAPAATGVNYWLGGVNGICASQQQPSQWDQLRVEYCRGYGILQGDIQQAPMHNLEVLSCGVAFEMRGTAEFIAIDTFNAENSIAHTVYHDSDSGSYEVLNFTCAGIWHLEEYCPNLFYFPNGCRGLEVENLYLSNPGGPGKVFNFGTGPFLGNINGQIGTVGDPNYFITYPNGISAYDVGSNGSRGFNISSGGVTTGSSARGRWKRIEDRLGRYLDLGGGQHWSVVKPSNVVLPDDEGDPSNVGQTGFMVLDYDDTVRAWINQIGSAYLTDVLFPQKTITANYTLTRYDTVILVDATAGNIAISVPAPFGVAHKIQTGKIFILKRIDTSGHTVTFAGGDVDGHPGTGLTLAALNGTSKTAGSAAILIFSHNDCWSIVL